MIKRYQTKELASVLTEEYKLKKWLLVESVVAGVEEEARIIPKGLSKRLSKVVVKPERVREIEKVTNHDVIAFLEATREKLGEEGKWLHFGLTSYDLVDTAFVLIIREALEIILRDIRKFLTLLKKLSLQYKHTPQMGRTHGMFAQPITFGYKVASWHEEVLRNFNRLRIAKAEISYGKLSGAVGSYTMLSPTVEKKVMKRLQLKPEPVSTQVLPRDRFAFVLSVLVLYACGIERIATEIRNLSRSEIGELLEPFTKGQKGSSSMPHKKNPITCERVCGLARVIRGYVHGAYENINLWHERDITNSSVERIIFPDTFHLVHYITQKMIWVLKNLRVYPERMLENIKNSLSVYASQPLMNALIDKGMDRTEAYGFVQGLSFRAVDGKVDLKELAMKDKTVSQYINKNEIERIFDIEWYVRNIVIK